MKESQHGCAIELVAFLTCAVATGEARSAAAVSRERQAMDEGKNRSGIERGFGKRPPLKL